MEHTGQEAAARQENLLHRLLQGYGEHYEIRHHQRVAGRPVRAIAEMHMAEERRLLGFSAPRMGLGSSESGEYVLFLLADTLTPALAEETIALAEAAEQELGSPGEDHAFTFFSVVLLVDRVEKPAADRLKRHSLRRTYKVGWGLVRIAAVELPTGKLACNRDGKELGRLVLTRLKA